jgi:cation diffusion facilitator family transporter
MAAIAERDRAVRRVIAFEGAVNFAVVIAKLSVGLATGSLAIIGDAIHSVTDVTNNIIAWLVMRLAASPADREHPYGHHKFETLAVFALAALLVVLAFELVIRALTREQTNIVDSTIGLVVMLAVLVVNIGLTLWQRHWAKKLNSAILSADASHTLSDVATTVMVIIGWQLSLRGLEWLDQLCALAVALLVFYLAYDLFRKALPILSDEFALDPEQVTQMVKAVHGVEEVLRVRSRWIGTHKSVDLVIGVEATLSTAASHAIATEVENNMEAVFDVSDVSVHVEPV